MELSFGISSCPNDTYIFWGLYKGLVDVGVSLRFIMEDVETLNRMVLERRLDVSKVSVAVLRELKGYVLLRAGGAFSYQGPVVVARDRIELGSGVKVAIPGEHTTAHLLFSRFYPEVKNKVFMPFDEIIDAVSKGVVDAGVLIHEGRFVYPRFGLVLLGDLGRLWMEETGLPVPLGGIVVKKELSWVKEALEEGIRKSLELSRKSPEVMGFIRENAKHMDDETVKKHIETYVNEFTYDMGKKGEDAVKVLLGL